MCGNCLCEDAFHLSLVNVTQTLTTFLHVVSLYSINQCHVFLRDCSVSNTLTFCNLVVISELTDTAIKSISPAQLKWSRHPHSASRWRRSSAGFIWRKGYGFLQCSSMVGNARSPSATSWPVINFQNIQMRHPSLALRLWGVWQHPALEGANNILARLNREKKQEEERPW